MKQFNIDSKQKYDIMLYPDKKPEYNGPPILLAIFKNKNMTKAEFESIAKEILKSYNTNLKDFIPSEYSSEVKMLKLGQGYYNKKGNYFTYIYEAEIINVGKIYNISTIFYTPNGFLCFLFSDYSNKYLSRIDGFIQLVKSVKK